MATAIIVVYTREGFVVAADRRRTLPDGSFLDDATKIRHVEGTTFAFAVAGTAQLTKDRTSTEVVFDLGDELLNAVGAVTLSAPFSLRKCVRLACARVNSGLAEWKARGCFDTYPKGANPSNPGVIAEAFFVGYHKGAPSFVHAKFEHRDQQLMDANPQEARLYPGSLVGYGSPEIVKRFNDRTDLLLSPYRDNIEPDERTLENAIALAGNYFKACADPNIRRLDEPQCASVSEVFHLGVIRASKGFEWVIGPDDKN